MRDREAIYQLVETMYPDATGATELELAAVVKSDLRAVRAKVKEYKATDKRKELAYLRQLKSQLNSISDGLVDENLDGMNIPRGQSAHELEYDAYNYSITKRQAQPAVADIQPLFGSNGRLESAFPPCT